MIEMMQKSWVTFLSLQHMASMAKFMMKFSNNSFLFKFPRKGIENSSSSIDSQGSLYSETLEKICHFERTWKNGI